MGTDCSFLPFKSSVVVLSPIPQIGEIWSKDWPQIGPGPAGMGMLARSLVVLVLDVRGRGRGDAFEILADLPGRVWPICLAAICLAATCLAGQDCETVVIGPVVECLAIRRGLPSNRALSDLPQRRLVVFFRLGVMCR